ncbi:hypothetical protein EGR_05232 [Echinococcus granulosus]|uniref:Uncharacterized protein n=1 Tax=Echinococcus granulosus TaxID=6210 RepID=W6UFZ2_ECHGR|nr:hypothetical protein EGR_05232 [Echinococcus granulosus]EUB59906.1 hypothetical protein EGR_05232 [Echinococcus granulosus]
MYFLQILDCVLASSTNFTTNSFFFIFGNHKDSLGFPILLLDFTTIVRLLSLNTLTVQPTLIAISKSRPCFIQLLQVTQSFCPFVLQEKQKKGWFSLNNEDHAISQMRLIYNYD